MNDVAEPTEALVAEIVKLRKALERNQKALLNGREAAAYIGFNHVVFYRLVAAGVIPQTKLTDDLTPRYWRVALDRVIEECTKVVTQ